MRKMAGWETTEHNLAGYPFGPIDYSNLARQIPLPSDTILVVLRIRVGDGSF